MLLVEKISHGNKLIILDTISLEQSGVRPVTVEQRYFIVIQICVKIIIK